MDFYTRHANGREPTSVAEKLYRWSIPEPNSGIDAELFREIKARLAAGETNRAIGASIGASGTLIHDIRSGKHWTCAIYDGGRP